MVQPSAASSKAVIPPSGRTWTFRSSFKFLGLMGSLGSFSSCTALIANGLDVRLPLVHSHHQRSGVFTGTAQKLGPLLADLLLIYSALIFSIVQPRPRLSCWYWFQVALHLFADTAAVDSWCSRSSPQSFFLSTTHFLPHWLRNSSTLRSTMMEDIQPIAPMGGLTMMGYEVEWKQGHC